jgi:hypothetical protein
MWVVHTDWFKACRAHWIHEDERRFSLFAVGGSLPVPPNGAFNNPTRDSLSNSPCGSPSNSKTNSGKRQASELGNKSDTKQGRVVDVEEGNDGDDDDDDDDGLNVDEYGYPIKPKIKRPRNDRSATLKEGMKVEGGASSVKVKKDSSLTSVLVGNKGNEEGTIDLDLVAEGNEAGEEEDDDDDDEDDVMASMIEDAAANAAAAADAADTANAKAEGD